MTWLEEGVGWKASLGHITLRTSPTFLGWVWFIEIGPPHHPSLLLEMGHAAPTLDDAMSRAELALANHVQF